MHWSFNTPQAMRELLIPLKATLKTVPQVVVSGCLMGDKVRYDGGHKHQQHLQTRLADLVILRSFCPEMAADMGVPRKPIQWVETAQGEQRLQQVNAPYTLFETPIRQACENWLANESAIEGAILKARSPSCGIGSTPVVSTHNRDLPSIDGVWAQHLKVVKPTILMADESFFEDHADSLWFVALLYLRQLILQGDAPQGLAPPHLDLEASESDRQAIYQQLGVLINNQ